MKDFSSKKNIPRKKKKYAYEAPSKSVYIEVELKDKSFYEAFL